MPPSVKFKHGCSVDVGTMNLVSARMTTDGKITTSRIRDAFIDLEPEAKKSLKMGKVSYAEMDGQLIVLGDSALKMANLFNRELRRPLAKGLIASGEVEAQKILSLMIAQVLEEPKVEGEHCYYSVPAAPIDLADQDVVYHTEVFRKMVAEHGYTPHPMNEAMAIIYSNCAEENFSGLAISFGSGMCNVALAYQTVEGMSFSVARGGDWIDTHAGKALNMSASKVCALKEKGVDLLNPSGREAEAIAMYIRAEVRYCLENAAAQFRRVAGAVSLPEPIPLVVSGGTTRAGNFLKVFEEEFAQAKKKGFPIEVSEVRMATDPMTAVAEGLLVLALEESLHVLPVPRGPQAPLDPGAARQLLGAPDLQEDRAVHRR